MRSADPIAVDAATTEAVADETAEAREQDLEKLLDELQAASRLMDDIAAASDLLPTPYRLKADMLGRNLMMLYRSGKRSAGSAPEPVNPGPAR